MKAVDTRTMARGFRVLAKTKRSEAATMVLEAGENTGSDDNRHQESDQWLYVVSGTGIAIVEGRKHPLAEGVLLLIEAGETHEIIGSKNEPLHTLNFYAPCAY